MFSKTPNLEAGKNARFKQGKNARLNVQLVATVPPVTSGDGATG